MCGFKLFYRSVLGGGNTRDCLKMGLSIFSGGETRLKCNKMRGLPVKI